MPTKGFVLALVLMFAFNCWCGMRADGVTYHCTRGTEIAVYADLKDLVGIYVEKAN